MIIEEAVYDSGYIKLKTTYKDARRFLERFKAGEYEVTPRKEKRSNNANSYAWVLMRKIAETMKVSPEEVYTRAIENISGKTTVISVAEFAVEDFERAFKQNHIGRKVEIIGERSGMVDLMVTYGSSDYSTKQMSELLDSVITECEALGIEHKSRDYIDILISEWAEKSA